MEQECIVHFHNFHHKAIWWEKTIIVKLGFMLPIGLENRWLLLVIIFIFLLLDLFVSTVF